MNFRGLEKCIGILGKTWIWTMKWHVPATNRRADWLIVVQSERGNQRDGLSLAPEILLRIPVARILRDFDFLRGLAPGRLDGFSIGRYEKKRESFDFHAAKFESGAMRFWGEKSPGARTLSKQGFLPCLSIIKNSQRRTQIHSKSLQKPLLRQKDEYTPQIR